MKNYVFVGVDITDQVDKYFEDYEMGIENEDAIPEGLEILCGEYMDNILMGMPLSEDVGYALEPENYNMNELMLTFEAVRQKTGKEPFLYVGHVNN